MAQAKEHILKGKTQPDVKKANDLKAMQQILKKFCTKEKLQAKSLVTANSIEELATVVAALDDDTLKKLVKEIDGKNTALERIALKKLSLTHFWYFCKLKAPKFYKDSRRYLRILCDEMQSFYEGDDLILVVNLPPRHGKSFTSSLFAQWIFGKNRNEKIMTGSYNETLSTKFSKTVRNSISEKKTDKSSLVYSDIFPDTKIQRGDASMTLWSLEGADVTSYLATSPTGTATGFGASFMIIDDLIKNKYEAFNQNILQGHWEWFTDTMLSRLEENGKIIIIMTRWASGDLAGRAVKHFEEMKMPCKVISMKAVDDDGNMLCEEVLSKKSYLMKTKSMSAEIASANYQQIPIDLKGRLYNEFKTYPSLESIRGKFSGIYAYIDTADEGADYLMAYIFGDYNKEAYIIDTLYTKDAMEFTEPALAKLLHEHNVDLARIESNNGGRGFARSVLKYSQDVLGNFRTVIKWFHQSKNKKARILSNATYVMEHVYFPENWKYRWGDLHRDLSAYQRSGKNEHDDAPDGLTGVAETMFKIGGA